MRRVVESNSPNHAPSFLYLSVDDVNEGVGRTQVLNSMQAVTECSGSWGTVLAVGEHPAQMRIGQLSIIQFAGGSRRVPIAVVRNLVRFPLFARTIDFDIVVARSFQTLPAAWLISVLFKKPLVYDTRGFWIRARFKPSVRRAVLLTFEKLLMRRARHVLYLTHISAELRTSGILGRVPKWQKISAIPTLVDRTRFETVLSARVTTEQLVGARRGPVVAIIGSINRDYLFDEMVSVFRRVAALDPTSSLLIVTPQIAAADLVAAELTAEGLNAVSRSADWDSMPKILERIDFALTFLRNDFDKWASFPTRLGEFIASGIPVVHYGCNAEVECVVLRADRRSLVLGSLQDDELDRAAGHILAHYCEPPRETPQEVQNLLSLVEGARKYCDVFGSVASDQMTSAAR